MSDFSSFIQQEVTSESLPCILSDLGLLHAFVRRILLNRCTSNISPSEEEQVAFQKSFFKANNITNKDSLDFWLSKNNIQESEMSVHLYRSLKLEIFKNETFGSQVQSYFLKNKSSFDFCYFSLLRTDRRESINELYLRLTEDGDTFSSLATEFSLGSESQSNGYIGPRPFSEIHPEFAERLRISSPGQLWSPFQVNSYWCIIRLERIISSSLDKQTSSKILNKLFESWISSEVETTISSFGLLHLTNSSSFTKFSPSHEPNLS